MLSITYYLLIIDWISFIPRYYCIWFINSLLDVGIPADHIYLQMLDIYKIEIDFIPIVALF